MFLNKSQKTKIIHLTRPTTCCYYATADLALSKIHDITGPLPKTNALKTILSAYLNTRTRKKRISSDRCSILTHNPICHPSAFRPTLYAYLTKRIHARAQNVSQGKTISLVYNYNINYHKQIKLCVDKSSQLNVSLHNTNLPPDNATLLILMFFIYSEYNNNAANTTVIL